MSFEVCWIIFVSYLAAENIYNVCPPIDSLFTMVWFIYRSCYWLKRKTLHFTLSQYEGRDDFSKYSKTGLKKENFEKKYHFRGLQKLEEVQLRFTGFWALAMAMKSSTWLCFAHLSIILVSLVWRFFRASFCAKAPFSTTKTTRDYKSKFFPSTEAE